MRKIFCNANVYIGITNQTYPEELIAKLRLAEENRSIAVFGIPTNLFELLQGIITEEHFQRAREAVVNMLTLSKRKMLADPKLHVQRAVCRHLGLREPPFDVMNNDFAFIADDIAASFSFEMVREDVTEWQRYFSGFYDKWVPDTEKVAVEPSKIHEGKYVTPKGKRVTVDEFLGCETPDILWPAIKQRFEIEPLVEDAIHSDIIPKVLPISCWYGVNIGYYRKLGKDGKKPISSDLIDIEQIVYLDVMDFFIFEDAKFAEVLRRSLSPELASKCLSLEKFIEMLETENQI